MRAPLGAALIALAASACAMPEHGQVVAAREAWETCVRDEGAEHDDCLVLQERLRVVQRRYEERSRSAWGCDPAREECPTPR